MGGEGGEGGEEMLRVYKVLDPASAHSVTFGTRRSTVSIIRSYIYSVYKEHQVFSAFIRAIGNAS